MLRSAFRQSCKQLTAIGEVACLFIVGTIRPPYSAFKEWKVKATLIFCLKWRWCINLPLCQNLTCNFSSFFAHKCIQLADELSRFQDDSQILLCHDIFQFICNKWGYSICDLFAGSAVGEHKAEQLFSMNNSLSTSGVDALSQCWQNTHEDHGRKLLWAFPPFYLTLQVLSKIKAEGVDTILIVPRGVRSWTPCLLALPVKDRLSSSGPSLVCRRGSQAPAYFYKPEFWLHLVALLVKFQ